VTRLPESAWDRKKREEESRKEQKKTKEVIQSVPNPALFAIFSFLSAMVNSAVAEGLRSVVGSQ
jgi:hypothetical protein